MLISAVGHLTVDPETHGQTIVDMARRLGSEVFLRQNEALLHRRDRRNDLASLSCPVLAACGRQDEVCPPSMHRDLARRIPHARLSIVDRTGYLSTIDQPEDLTSLLTLWLNLCNTMALSDDGWLGIAPAGDQITMRSLDFWRLETDPATGQRSIRENWVLVDLLHVWDQLGVYVLWRMQELDRPQRLTRNAYP